MRFPVIGFLLLSGTCFAQNQPSLQVSRSISQAEGKSAEKKIQPVRISTAGSNIDLKYHRFNWQVDPAVYAIGGAVTSYFTAKQSGVSNISFDLAQTLAVDSVIRNGQHLSFSHPGEEVFITLPTALASGQLDSVTVWYHGSPPSTGFGSFAAETHGPGTPVLWTLSEPYGAMDWWPSKIGLDDKIDSIDVFVTCPQGNKVASNGLLVQELNLGANKRVHWRHRYPIASYLIASAVTDYSDFTDVAPLQQGNLPILNYMYPEYLSTAQAQSQAIIPVMQLYDTLLAPYPFMNEKYGHAQFNWGGGMEHQTMSFMHDLNYELMAHELAHQWFGDEVTCGSWTDIWLNEGWATYATGLSFQYVQTQYWDLWKLLIIQDITSQPDGSVWVDDTTSVGRIFDGRLSYSKGSMLLHMLRWKMGDQAFFTGVRNYLNQRQYGFARTSDFQQHLEQASGLSLSGFFQDWFYGQGYPSYQVQWAQGAGGGAVSVSIGQTQSHSSVSFFEMPVPVRFYGGGQDTTLVFQHSFSGQNFAAILPFQIDSVRLDPDRWLVQANSSVTGFVTGLPETAQPLQVNVWPNPVSADIHFTVSVPGAGLVTLTDLAGREVLRQSYSQAQTEQKLEINKLPAGMYILQFNTVSGIYTQQIMKQ
jgi:aminopeptidase N